MRQRGFALFEVLLAVILMAIAAAGSYTLVKSFRSNSVTQQFIRYSTIIAQGYVPFLEEGDASTAIVGDALSDNFLSAVGIPTEDKIASDEEDASYVNSGMYKASGDPIQMTFAISPSTASTHHLLILASEATATQVNQVLQNAASLFSIYCPEAGGTAVDPCSLLPRSASGPYDLWLVFPKSGNTFPGSS